MNSVFEQRIGHIYLRKKKKGEERGAVPREGILEICVERSRGNGGGVG